MSLLIFGDSNQYLLITPLQHLTLSIFKFFKFHQGDYVRLWVPELDGIKSSKIHKTWCLDASDLKSSKVELGKTYPEPIAKAAEWAD